VRTPSRADSGIRINSATYPSPFDPDGPGPLGVGDPTLISAFGRDDIDSETVFSYELGFRGQPTPGLTLDITAFYNDFEDLTTSEQSFAIEQVPAPPHVLIANSFDNQMKGESYGLEVEAKLQITPTWRLIGSYSWLKLDMSLDGASTDYSRIQDLENSSPEHQFQLHSRWDINDELEVDFGLYLTESIEARDASSRVHIPGYARLDVNIGWTPHENIRLNLVGQNLLDSKHPEFVTFDTLASEVPRSLYGQITVSF
jgi:iron complex outermembrane receptor protein